MKKIYNLMDESINKLNKVKEKLNTMRDNKSEIIEGKNPNRVPAYYRKHQEDWNAQYNMLLMDNVTCKDCVHCIRCVMLFGQKETDTSCQFYPSRFKGKAT